MSAGPNDKRRLNASDKKKTAVLYRTRNMAAYRKASRSILYAIAVAEAE